MGLEQDIIKNTKRIEFYTKYVWKFHRPFVKKHLSKRCNKCILSEKYTKILEDGKCELCHKFKPEDNTSLSEKTKLIHEMDKLIEKSLNSENHFDALVLFSGGKDSTYLVHKLKEAYPALRILLLTVDNNFMSPIALKNINELVSKLNCDHMCFKPKLSFYQKMFSYAITNLNEKGTSGTVDQFDGDSFHDVARNIAYNLKIPLIISGISPKQVENNVGIANYIVPLEFEKLKRKAVANIILTDIFNNDEMKYWWDGTTKDKNKLPRTIFPYYAWGYNEDEVKQKVVDLKLINKNSNSPLLTNMILIPLMGIVDVINFGYSSYEPEFAELIRNNKAKRSDWISLFEFNEYISKTGNLIGNSLDPALEKLVLTKEKLNIK